MRRCFAELTLTNKDRLKLEQTKSQDLGEWSNSLNLKPPVIQWTLEILMDHYSKLDLTTGEDPVGVTINDFRGSFTVHSLLVNFSRTVATKLIHAFSPCTVQRTNFVCQGVSSNASTNVVTSEENSQNATVCSATRKRRYSYRVNRVDDCN